MAKFVTPKLMGFSYVTPIKIVNNQPRFLTDSVSLRRQIVSTGSQRWELGISFHGGHGDNLFGKFHAHYIKQASTNNNAGFEIAMPQNQSATLDFTIPSNVGVNINTGGGAAGDKSISVRLDDTDATGTIPAGWFVRFSNHSKVYMVTDEATFSANSTYTLPIAPALVEDVPDTATMLVHSAIDESDANGVRIRVLHEDSNTSLTYSQGVQQQVSWSFVEAL